MLSAALGERDDKARMLRRDPILCTLDDQLQEFRIAQSGHLGHQVELAVPTPAWVWIGLEQFDLPLGICAKIESRIISAAEPLEQNIRVVDNFPSGFLVYPRLAIDNLRPIRGVGDPFGFIWQKARQLGVEARIVDLQWRQHAIAKSGIPDDSNRIFWSGQKFLDQDRAARHLFAQPTEAGDGLLPGMDYGILGDADRGVAKIRLDKRREYRWDGCRQVIRIEVGLRRHWHVDRLGNPTN